MVEAHHYNGVGTSGYIMGNYMIKYRNHLSYKIEHKLKKKGDHFYFKCESFKNKKNLEGKYLIQNRIKNTTIQVKGIYYKRQSRLS